MDNLHLLDRARIGILISNRRDGTAIGVPVWVDWNGSRIRCFAAANSPKLERLRRDPRASILVTNEVGEAEAWIAFDGDVTVATEGGVELAGRLAARYWDLTDPAIAARLEGWMAHPEAFALLELVPTRIRSGS